LAGKTDDQEAGVATGGPPGVVGTGVSRQAADGQRQEGEQAEDKDARGLERSVDNGGWWRQEGSVNGVRATRENGGREEEAVTISEVMLLR
jgi:hypothetical protein